MANTDNLKRGNPDTQFQSGRKAVDAGRKGGIASGEAKRRKKTLRETAEIMLQTELPDDVKAKLKDKGIDAADYSDAVIAYAIQSVMRGNSNMFGQLLKLMGEGSERIELQNLNDDSAAALDELFKENERKFNQSDQS